MISVDGVDCGFRGTITLAKAEGLVADRLGEWIVRGKRLRLFPRPMEIPNGKPDSPEKIEGRAIHRADECPQADLAGLVSWVRSCSPYGWVVRSSHR
jgi:hypothetical protein